MNNSNSEIRGVGRARQRMIVEQLESRQISDQRVLRVMGEVRRESFISEALQSRAYDDSPLPIGDGQTISQPFMVALMTQELNLQGTEKVLEIGTGSGYQTAILAELAGKVFTIERSYNLSQQARKVLEKLGYSNVLLRYGDGTIGWDEFAPYDRIIVTAGSPDVPDSLKRQLADGGIMVVPVGDRYRQDLMVINRHETGYESRNAGGCVFVPLIGREGWSANG
ncbi:protein-L-isoaspartate O-methyltransferase [candidate division LCP-89 bacterium B3_LCP]|uniref:Protein-L-isoaspartate O-methyltransferase n=1 Tax=candidate division LCP-89 bacterium B3_LCP TaxID=2012998 RepID=A0A532V3Q4_UNCL8|nr:MAG: protein-L-isoaspartate O-methyltransferase [candidate division LCP-89 bacterium B3_LCP]